MDQTRHQNNKARHVRCRSRKCEVKKVIHEIDFAV
jgi:hypothetical protein